MKRVMRILLAATVGSLAVVTAGAPPAAAQQCVSSGAALSPVPWAQQTLAPERVWPMTTGAGQRVAVISTGVSANPQLRGRIAGETDLAPAQTQGQASGKTDCLGIGTGVAGIIAAQQSIVVGFHGMAPAAEVLSAKVARDSYPQAGNSVAPETLAAAINWAVDRGATVIAVPTITYSDSESLRQAVRRALADNIVIVASVGDTSQNDPLLAFPFPAAYEGVIGVGSIGQGGGVAGTSRASYVDLVAPGDGVVTTYPDSSLGMASGTAFATAYVAGTVALTRAYRPGLSNSDIAKRLAATATPAPEGTGSASYGYGIVNPYDAVLSTVVAGNPVDLPALTPKVVSAEEKARQDAEQDADNLAYTLAAAGAAVAALMAAVVVFGPRGRRRRWRSGFAPLPEDRPEDELPEPPAELFARGAGPM